MPKIPKLIGTIVKTAWSKMFIKASVIEKEQLTENLLRIRFTGPLRNTSYQAGQAILIQISDTEYRNYTPSAYNTDQDYFDVIFNQNADGPGTLFFKNIKINDQVTTSLPRGINVYDKNIDYHFFYGDETCIGFCQYLEGLLKKDNKKLKGILEVNDRNIPYATTCLRDIEFIQEPSTEKASAAIDYLDSIDSFEWNRLLHGQFYIMGNAKSISNFRKALKARGVSSNNIITQPFWAEGKIGL